MHNKSINIYRSVPAELGMRCGLRTALVKGDPQMHFVREGPEPAFVTMPSEAHLLVAVNKALGDYLFLPKIAYTAQYIEANGERWLHLYSGDLIFPFDLSKEQPVLSGVEVQVGIIQVQNDQRSADRTGLPYWAWILFALSGMLFALSVYIFCSQ